MTPSQAIAQATTEGITQDCTADATRCAALIRADWSRLCKQGPAFAACFYETLFALDPALKAMFKGDMAMQGNRLVGMLGSAIDLLDQPDSLMPALRNLGSRHGGYGVKDAHYDVVGRALLDTLSCMLGDGFTSANRAAWADTYGTIARVMMEAARKPKPMLADAPKVRMSAMAAMALVMAGAMSTADAQQVGWHPATSARPMIVAGIDPNTFIVGHPASPTTRGGHAGSDHPAVLMARQAGQRSIDANTFIVQPPAAVTWIATPLQDDAVRYADARGVLAAAAK